MSRRLELGALLGLCLFLPIYEAPKSIFWALYVVVWIVNRIRTRDFGGRWDRWDSLFAAWIGSGFVVAAFAGVRGGNEWGDALDLLRYGSVAWLVKRSRFSPRELAWTYGALLASTLIGLAMAYFRMWRGQDSLQLNSVGHVNHTAIYLAIMLGLAAAWLFAAWPRWKIGIRTAALLSALVIVAGLVTTASRGAIAVGLVMVLVLAAFWWPRWRVPLQASGVLIVVTALAMVIGAAEVLRKHEKSLETGNPLSYRGEVWSMAVAGWQRHPWFGVGMGNFGQVTPYRDRAERKKDGAVYDTTQALEFAHGHSLFMNALAERGLVGLAALLAWLGALGWSLARERPAAAADDPLWLAWGAAASAWIVTVGVGVVNTTLHHEHGILASMLLGLWLSQRAGR